MLNQQICKDDYTDKKGVIADSNMQFVARAKRIIEEFRCKVVTPAEARELLSLK